MSRRHWLFPVALSLAIVLPAAAQETVLQNVNVRTEYAQVLRAEPVYQTLRATSMVQRCDKAKPSKRVASTEEKHGLSRMYGAVKSWFSSEDDPSAPPPDMTSNDDGNGKPQCHMEAVDKQFQRPIAYDVDYVHHGIKYRSRLPYDPGNRLRVRVSIVPIVPSPSTTETATQDAR